VTVSMLVAGKIKARDAVAYVVVQCVGAVLAAGVLYGIASGSPVYSLGVFGLDQNGYGGAVGGASPAGFPLASCFAAEVVLTFIFLLVIHGATSERAPKGFSGVAIGFSLVLVHIVGIPVTGTSVNPARSLGPAVFVGGTALSQLWLFWVAPLIGGILAALVWQAIELK
jgi:aquaporin Z